MRSATLLLPLALGLLGGPALAQMGTGNKAPLVDSVAISPSPAPPNAAAQINCAGHDTDGLIRSVRYSVTGGTLPNGTTLQTVILATPAATVSDSISWSTPAPGTYSVTCTVFDNGGLFGGSASASLTVPATVAAAASQPPVISALVASESRVLVGGELQFSAAASDPEGAALTWTWSATGGTFGPGTDQAVWTAPSAPGSYTITLTVVDPTGQSANTTKSIEVVLKLQQDGLAAILRAPRRVVAGPTGTLYVVDAGTGGLWMLTPRGDPLAAAKLSERATAVTLCAGVVLVSTGSGKLLKFEPSTLRPLGAMPVTGGPLSGAAGLACDETRGYVYAAELEAARVRAIRPDGSTAFTLTAAGLERLKLPVDVVVHAGSSTLWVGVEQNEGGSLVYAFDTDGVFRRAIAPDGAADGKVSRVGGLTVNAAGDVYIADFFQGVVKVFTQTGGWVGKLGAFGAEPGNLRRPSGLAWLGNGDLVVSNFDVGKLERFGTGASLPQCPGDSDCDGLPDTWELAFGFDPNNPRDALVDADGDGLVNLDEFKHGTSPRNADSDGDGYGDGEEVLAGYNPMDPNDHKPSLLVASANSDPGLVVVEGSIQGRGACAVTWTQTAGPTVVLRDPTSATPSFVGRQAGPYTFSGVPRCGMVSGDPAEATITVQNLAPRADPGRGLAVRSGETFLLDGTFSSDVNGGSLTLGWDQTLGPPRLAPTSEASLSVRGHRPGLYSFQLTATDSLGLSAAAEVPVLVVDEGRQAPTAMASSPVFGLAGQAVALDGSSSVGPQGTPLRYAWRQVSGPAVVLSTPDGSKPTFTPASAGRYEFELSVEGGTVRSPAEKVEVYVSQGSGLPVAVTQALLSAAVGEPVSVDGSASTPTSAGGALSYAWRQVSGPAAGLTRAQGKVASVVPFEPGSYVFELRVKEGAVEGVPAFVRIEADAPGRVRPVAVAQAVSLVTEGEEVFLDASASTGPGGATLRYRWTQVSGPWVALDDPSAVQASFTPHVAGLYTFELEVDGAAVRSAPASVGILVFPQARGGQP